MSPMAVIGGILLIVILIVGTIVKLKTRKTVQDMDGLDSTVVGTEDEMGRFVNDNLE